MAREWRVQTRAVQAGVLAWGAFLGLVLQEFPVWSEPGQKAVLLLLMWLLFVEDQAALRWVVDLIGFALQVGTRFVFVVQMAMCNQQAGGLQL